MEKEIKEVLFDMAKILDKLADHNLILQKRIEILESEKKSKTKK